jgi:hypothetical protein
MTIKNTEIEPNEAAEEKQIKNAVIDLLHYNEKVTHEAISKATGISVLNIDKHSQSIQSMLAKLKKIYNSPNLKS